MQIHTIAHSLKELAASAPMAAALVEAGFNGHLEYGVRASQVASGEKPNALLVVDELEREFNTGGVALVTYEVTLTVYADERIETVGSILEMFHRYWDRIAGFPAGIMAPDVAAFVSIHPGDTEIGEATEEDLGKDVIVGTTSWTLLITEHQPQLLGV